MGHATGVFLAEKLFFSFEDNEMILLQLQSLGSDGPNATKIVRNKQEEQISALPQRKRKGLVNVSICNLHGCHNPFQKGLQVFHEDVAEFVISVHICDSNEI